MDYTSTENFSHQAEPKLGILLGNIGTPDAPTAAALRPYLKKFLSDPRVIELPKWKWLPILHLFVLTFRPRKSAALYKKIWTEQGSPLLTIAKEQRAALQQALDERGSLPAVVEVGMACSEPSIAAALRKLRDAGATKLLVLPLFPQYSGTSSASIFDAVTKELQTWRWVPEMRTIMSYHDHPGYISALAASVQEYWAAHGRAEKLVISFHGIPLRYFAGGDPYYCHCQKTARLLGEALGLTADKDYLVTFQSIFGKEEWIQPATDHTLEALAKEGVRSVQVVCPGFSADCLETLEEIKGENKDVFIEAGGSEFGYIPALNSRDDIIQTFADLLEQHAQGWAFEKPSRSACPVTSGIAHMEQQIRSH